MLPDSDWSLVGDVFDAVVELAPSDRPAALDRLCAGADDPAALRAEVEALLLADSQAGTGDGVLSLTVAASAAALIEDDPVEGERVGPWRVIRPIGRGGMGRVDLVERVEGGYQQRAALKRMSLVAPGRVRRFLRERQILARLEHPGIARLLDGGVADDGAPYLVMEYVEGEPITTYAQRHDVGLRDRLALFVQVCDAVAYAHRHLVVHRDLKPSNVLVSTETAPTDAPLGTGPNGTPSPKSAPTGATSAARGPHVSLLDFGIARLLEDDPDEPITAEGPGAPLTPGYAAPEQVAGEAVTTATDVYSLGVLLYELLTGRRPHPADTRQAWAESVLHRTPPLPSQTAPGGRTTLQKRLRGDLDAITLTALRREPEARYASALDLAADLRRYLAGQPVLARRPSTWYRTRRFVGRHRGSVAAAALVAVAVLGGAASTLWQARQTQAQALQSQATADFLTGLFQGADPTAAASDSVTALDLLGRGARRLDTELAEQPDVRADLYTVVGRSYLGLGRADSAAAFARRALAVRQDERLAPDPEATVRARILLGQALFVSDPVEGNRQLADAVAQARTVGDAALLDALEAQATLAGNEVLSPTETVAVFDQAIELARRVEGEGSPRLGRLLTLLAFKVSSAHQHGRVEPLLLQAVASLPADRAPFERSTALVYLADLQAATGKPDIAWQTLGEAMTLRRRILPPGDVRIAEVLSVRARLGGDGPEQAERDAREAVEITRPVGGDAHVTALGALGHALLARERYGDAVDVFRRRVALAAEVYGVGSTGYPATTTNVARTLHRAGRYDEAARAWAETLRVMAPAFGAESAQMVSTLLEASKTEEARGQTASAERMLTQAHAAGQGLATTSGVRARSGLHLGRVRLGQGRAADAIAPLRTALDGLDALARPGERSEGPDAERAQALMGRALVATGDATRGRRLLARAVPVLEREFGHDHPETLAARAALDG